MADKYDEMTGPVLTQELAKRELSVTGRVDELRARLREDDVRRAQADADGPGDGSEDDETRPEPPAVPEPREPVEYKPMSVILNEDQARELNRGEMAVARHFRYVTGTSDRKFAAGDHVVGIADWPNRKCRVLPLGVEITLSDESGG